MPGKIQLLDPQQPDAVGAIVEREFDVILDADIGFDADQLAIERPRRLAAGGLAAHQRGPPRFPAAPGIRSRVAGCGRDHQRAAIAIDQTAPSRW